MLFMPFWVCVQKIRILSDVAQWHFDLWKSSVMGPRCHSQLWEHRCAHSLWLTSPRLMLRDTSAAWNPRFSPFNYTTSVALLENRPILQAAVLSYFLLLHQQINISLAKCQLFVSSFKLLVNKSTFNFVIKLRVLWVVFFCI